MPDQTTASTIAADVAAISAIASPILSAVFPQEVVLNVALQAILREAPHLYASFVALLAGGKLTAEQDALWQQQVADLQNPEKMLKESRDRVLR